MTDGKDLVKSFFQKPVPGLLSNIPGLPGQHIAAASGAPCLRHQIQLAVMPEHLGIIRLSCPPQLTAIKICWRLSQNFSICVMVSALIIKVNKPQAPLICCLANSYCGKLSSKGKITFPLLDVALNKLLLFL